MKIVFVQRPTVEQEPTLIDALRTTAKNGKALRVPWRLTNFYTTTLRRERLAVRQVKRGTFFLAWCENGTKKKGAR